MKWKIEITSVEGVLVTDERGKIVHVQDCPENSKDFYVPNSQTLLIAAAPDLLEAAKFALISLSAAAGCLGDEKLYAAARSDLHKAIAKTEDK